MRKLRALKRWSVAIIFVAAAFSHEIQEIAAQNESPVSSAPLSGPIETAPRPHVSDRSRIVIIPRALRSPKLEDFLENAPADAGALITDFRQREPGDGTPVSWKTSAYLSYDEKNLYAVFVCEDEPEKVRARLSRREDTAGDDEVTIYLDTFHDGQRAYYFSVNPLGIQSDGIYSGGRHDGRFDTLWYSAGRITSSGYVAIISIPFTSLRFSSDAPQMWGIALRRDIVRNSESSFWPYITRRESSFVQQLGTINGLGVLSRDLKLELIPYANLNSGKLLDASVPHYEKQAEFRGGMDAKMIVHDSFTVDLAANPDFSQVESDEPQVTVNKRFEVLFPEKRPFFLENLNYFETPLKLFFTRRIADPELGARATGRFGKWSLGLLGADDRAPGKVVDESSRLFGEHGLNGAVRLARDFGKDSIVGVLVTDRHFGASDNRILSADTRLRLSRNWYFTGQMARSRDLSYNSDSSLSARKGRAYFADLSYGGRRLNYDAGYRDVSSGFRAPLGFVQRVDVRQGWQYVGYTFFPENSKIQSFGPSVSLGVNWDQAGRLLDKYSYLDFRMDFAGPWGVHIVRSDNYETYLTRSFRYHTNSADFYVNWIKWFTFYGGIGNGSGVNYSPPAELEPFVGRTEDYSLGFAFRPTQRMRVEQYYDFNRFQAPPGFQGLAAGRASVFNNQLHRTKVNLQFTRALSFRAIIDYYSLAPNTTLFNSDRYKQLTGDLLFTYLLNPGTALYLGYNNRFENLAADPLRPPGLYRFGPPTYLTSRQVYVKLSYLLRR